jgi:hypothetical protein
MMGAMTVTPLMDTLPVTDFVPEASAPGSRKSAARIKPRTQCLAGRGKGMSKVGPVSVERRHPLMSRPLFGVLVIWFTFFNL